MNPYKPPLEPMQYLEEMFQVGFKITRKRMKYFELVPVFIGTGLKVQGWVAEGVSGICT